MNQVNSYLFNDGEQFVEFIDGLKEFYRDTNAENFFRENETDYLSMVQHLRENISDTSIDSIMNTMESYVSNKNLYFADQNVHYASVITMYRPSVASFYTVQMGDDVYLVAQQSLSGTNKNISAFDIIQFIETALHEFLHIYINLSVENQIELIEQITIGKKKADYAGTMYQDMDWNRVIDENIVRAVTARIYAIEYESDEEAFSQVLQKEIEMGGFTRVDELFELLKLYENDRIEYKNIDMYIPRLIYTMFE